MPPIQSVSNALAISDLDGDHRPDLVVSERKRSDIAKAVYSITVHLSTNSANSFELSASPAGLRLTTRDVDHDNDIDLVIETQLGEHVGVWLNDGQGRFTESTATVYPDWIWQDEPDLRPATKISSISAVASDEQAFRVPNTACVQSRACRYRFLPRSSSLNLSTESSCVHFVRPPPSYA